MKDLFLKDLKNIFFLNMRNL